MLVAVLGHRGMLGRRVLEAFPDAVTFDERYTGKQHDPLLEALKDVHPDWVINCIGALFDEPDLWSVNAILPHRLHHRWKLIQPSTDHVWDDSEYARSKHLGECGTVIRCAIVDPDGGMLARAREADTVGDVNREWNGITTKWWARIAGEVIAGRYSGLVTPGSPTISHFDLLETARRTFGWQTVTRVGSPRPWTASPADPLLPPLGEQLAEYL